MTELNEEERKAVASLKRLANKWPNTLWLLTNGQGLCILKADESGRPIMTENGDYDQDYTVACIDIHSDGFI